MLADHGAIEAIAEVGGKLNATLDGEGVLDFGVAEGNAEVNLAFRVGIDHVADAGGAAVETLRKTSEIAFTIFAYQGCNVGRQQQTQIATKPSVVELCIRLNGVD